MFNWIEANKVLPYQFGLALIMVANVVFHTERTIAIYLFMCAIAIFAIFIKELLTSGFSLLKEKCIVYLTILYAVYTFYGILLLRKGVYNWDFMLFTYILNICIYIALRHIFMQIKWISSISLPFIVSSIVIIVYLLLVEGRMIFVSQVETRIGDSMAGNVNTVASALGIISFVLSGYYSMTKRKKIFYALIPLLFFMLLTGSKKTVVVIVIDFFTIYLYARDKASSFLKVCLLSVLGGWLIIESPYFYDILGKRIEDMVATLFGIGHGVYSHSTDDREGMIAEALRLSFANPLFGGGMNYFSFASTKYSFYDYSHCNYTEILCNFGIVGFFIYYYPYFRNVMILWNNRTKYWMKSVFCILWIVITLALGLATVQFSDRCISYIPIIASYAMIESVRRQRLLNYLCSWVYHDNSCLSRVKFPNDE